MAGKALDLVTSTLQDVSPDSGVLTKLTAQSAKNKSQAIDAAIGKLFSNGIREEQIVHRDLRMWNANGGMALTFILPTESSWNEKAGAIGTWKISFEEPRPSIFGDWRICAEENQKIRCASSRTEALKRIHKELSFNQVLNYPLIKSNKELGTISAYILQQDWYGKSMSEFNSALDNDGPIAESMCLKIKNSIVNLGLNNDDADIVTWSFINGFPWAKKMHKDAFKALRADGADNSCAQSLKKIDGNRI
jgi:hypothetical protein